jgi:adenosylcobinamide-phosphate synthase
MEMNLHIIALLLGFLLDKCLGDPSWLPHPVVGFGKLISIFDSKFNKGDHRIIKGFWIAFVLITMVVVLSFMFTWGAYQIAMGLGIAVEALFIFFGIAGTTLGREGMAVFQKLSINLDEGRKQVARIVGRETQHLNAQQVAAATLETMAENLSDGVVAPLFWYGIAGIPGIVGYKMINTLDSMIGYKSDRYLLFGKFAAKLDDVVNYIPARITAIGIVIASGKLGALRFVLKYGRAHSSPNAGYPEAALAGVLDVRFGGAHYYFGKIVRKPFIGHNPRDFVQNDVVKTVKLLRIVEVLTLLVLAAMLYYNNLPLIGS